MANVKLYKNVYDKDQFKSTVDSALPTDPTPTQSIPSVGEFFNSYSQLFFDIPKTGETNSHEYLIKTSQAYVGDQQTNEEIDALIQEINGLRETVLQQQETIFNLTITGSLNG
jgi:hypothetical protein